MVVEIDDSGWGDLIGGVMIVMRRVETGEHYAGEVPLELFKQPRFKYKEYLRTTTQIILDGLDALEHNQAEPIHICTGYIFASAYETLRELGYKVKQVKIVGDTQELAEREFIKSLERLGAGNPYEMANVRSFNKLLNWVSDDLGAREKFVKDGWKSWEKHRRSITNGN